VKPSVYESLAVSSYRSRSAYIHPLAAARDHRFRLQAAAAPAPKARLNLLGDLIRLFGIAFGELMLVFAGLGTLVAMASQRRPLRNLGVISAGTIGMLMLIRLSGTLAASYNQTRLLLQLLIILAVPAAYLGERLAAKLRRLRLPLVFAVALALMLAYQDGATSLLVGGSTTLGLYQNGEDFERYYATPAEMAAATWVSDESSDKLLYADRYGQLRLSATTGAVGLNEVTPETLDAHAWLYATRTNVVLGRARGQIGNWFAIYRFPNAFLDAYFDTVFADGDSKVFHR